MTSIPCTRPLQDSTHLALLELNCIDAKSRLAKHIAASSAATTCNTKPCVSEWFSFSSVAARVGCQHGAKHRSIPCLVDCRLVHQVGGNSCIHTRDCEPLQCMRNTAKRSVCFRILVNRRRDSCEHSPPTHCEASSSKHGGRLSPAEHTAWQAAGKVGSAKSSFQLRADSLAPRACTATARKSCPFSPNSYLTLRMTSRGREASNPQGDASSA